MNEPYIGAVALFAGTFAPRGWAFCNGQLLSIAQNQALFSLLGTTYGGNGQTTFALPDLRGRVPIHFGQGPGLTNRTLGERAGEEAHALIAGELPAHVHGASTGASSAAGTAGGPAGGVWAASTARDNRYASSADTTMGGVTVTQSGSSQSHNNMQPYLALNFIIALEGLYPSRN
jgi:microcystin-dependent protein